MYLLQSSTNKRKEQITVIGSSNAIAFEVVEWVIKIQVIYGSWIINNVSIFRLKLNYKL